MSRFSGSKVIVKGQMDVGRTVSPIMAHGIKATALHAYMHRTVSRHPAGTAQPTVQTPLLTANPSCTRLMRIRTSSVCDGHPQRTARGQQCREAAQLQLTLRLGPQALQLGHHRAVRAWAERGGRG